MRGGLMRSSGESGVRYVFIDMPLRNTLTWHFRWYVRTTLKCLLPLLSADVADPFDEQGWFGVEVVGIAVDEIEFIVAAQVMQRE